MHVKSLAMLCGLLLAAPALADTLNGPNPYAAGYGFDTPTEAGWGGWNRGDANTVYAEWDTFTESSYPGTRTAAPTLGASGVTDAYLDWNSGTFAAGSGNLYSFSVTEVFNVHLTGTLPSGPVRAVLQTEGWGVDLDLATVLLNGVAPTHSALTFYEPQYPSSFGDVELKQRLFYWDLASAPTGYQFAFASEGHSLSLAQVSVDIAAAPVPEADTYALILAGLGLVGLQVRRRNRSAKTVS